MDSIQKTIKNYDLAPKKSLGQNFLTDPNLLDKIAKSAGSLEGKTVLEVGPGPGGLTRAILKLNPKKLIVIEKDQRCISALNELKTHFPQTDFQIIEADALTLKLADISPEKLIIIANLPYNISTVLLISWLEQISQVESMLLMFQKEVALRLTASPRSADYGRLSVMTQNFSQPQILFDVAPHNFTPAPKVTSSIVFIPAREYFYSNFKLLERLLKAAFGARRKMMRKNLMTLFPEIDAVLTKYNISLTARAEELALNDFINLAKELEQNEQR